MSDEKELDRKHLLQVYRNRQLAFEDRLRLLREKLEQIVCTAEPDDGVVLLSQEGPCHNELVDDKAIVPVPMEISVYNHHHFSPLGDALMELWRLTDMNTTAEEAKTPEPWQRPEDPDVAF